MAWVPISGIVPQATENGNQANGMVLKFYEPGTITPLAVGIDSTGITQTTEFILDIEGYTTLSENQEIPYVDQVYKIALYLNQVDADANDTGSAVYVIDDIDLANFIGNGVFPSLFGTGGVIEANLEAGEFAQWYERTPGSGIGGGSGSIVSTGTGFDLINPQLDNGNYVEQIFDNNINLFQAGCLNDWSSGSQTGTDTSANVNEVIRFCQTNTAMRKIVVGVGITISDVDATLLFSSGIIMEGSSTLTQPGTGNFNIIGANSQGIDISGTERFIMRDLTINGSTVTPPRTAIFATRVVANSQTEDCEFYEIKTIGSFSVAAVYNFAGEGWTSVKCIFSNSIDTACYYTTSNSAGLTSKFETTIDPVTTASPLTNTEFMSCKFHNNVDIQTGDTGPGVLSLGINFDGTTIGPDKSVWGITFTSCYFNGDGAASLQFIDCAGGPTMVGCIDESFSTGDPAGNDDHIFISGSGGSFMSGINLMGNRYLGGSDNVIHSQVEVRRLNYLGNVIVGNQNILFDLDLVSSHIQPIGSEGDFTVLGALNNTYIYPENNASKAKISFASGRNRAEIPLFPGVITNTVLPTVIEGELSVDTFHDLPMISVRDDAGSLNWQKILTAPEGSSNPTGGNWRVGQLARIRSFPNIVAGGFPYIITSDSGTAGTLAGGVTISTTSGSDEVTLTAGTVDDGSYINIAGVSGRKQILSRVGSALTIDSNADATVVDGAVTYYAASFLLCGQIAP